MAPPKVTKKLAVSNFKTRIKVVLTWILILGVVYALYFAFNMFPVISGFGAKNLCSCVFIQGRSAQDVINQEFGTTLGKLGSFSINMEDSSATGKVLFFSTKKAIYRKGLGCTLVNGLDEDELRSQKFLGKIQVDVNQDTIAWPDGNLLPDSLPAGFDKQALDKAVNNMFVENDPETPIKTRAVVVVYDGNIVAEKYADGFTVNTPQIGWALTGSINNALIGILVKQGKLKAGDAAPIEEWKKDDRKKITINDLLHSSSGLEWSEVYSRPSDATEMLFRAKDAALFAYSKKKNDEPNEKFYQSSGSSNILSWIVRKQVGEEGYHQFPYRRLFNKIGMNSIVMEPDPSGTYITSFGFSIPRDWARFGLLYLNDGVWHGEHIFPEGWVKYTTTPAPAATKGEFGAQWWLNGGVASDPASKKFPDVPSDAFYARGYEGQFLVIVPSKKLVVVRMGLTQHTEVNINMNKMLADIIATLPK